MPAYEFENKRHGIKVLLPFPVDQRPRQIVLKRRSIPSRINVGTGAKPETFSSQLRRGYKQREERGDFQGKQKPGYLTKKQIEKALAMPDTD